MKRGKIKNGFVAFQFQPLYKCTFQRITVIKLIMNALQTIITRKKKQIQL